MWNSAFANFLQFLNNFKQRKSQNNNLMFFIVFIMWASIFLSTFLLYSSLSTFLFPFSLHFHLLFSHCTFSLTFSHHFLSLLIPFAHYNLSLNFLILLLPPLYYLTLFYYFRSHFSYVISLLNFLSYFLISVSLHYFNKFSPFFISPLSQLYL